MNDGEPSSESADGGEKVPRGALPVKLRCFGPCVRLTSRCSRDSPFLRFLSSKNQAVAALRVQSGVVRTRYPQYMGFSFLTRGAFRRYSNCNPCLPCASGKALVRSVWDWHLIGKQGHPGRPPARFVQTARQLAQLKAHQDRPVIARDVRMMER